MPKNNQDERGRKTNEIRKSSAEFVKVLHLIGKRVFLKWHVSVIEPATSWL